MISANSQLLIKGQVKVEKMSLFMYKQDLLIYGYQLYVLNLGSRTNFITGTLHTSTAVAATTSTSSTSTSVLPSQPFTVQIQQTDQGTRLMIPTGQFSQFSSMYIFYGQDNLKLITSILFLFFFFFYLINFFTSDFFVRQ